MPDSVVNTCREFGEFNFRVIVAIGQFYMEKFIENTEHIKAWSITAIAKQHELPRKTLYKVIKGKRYKSGKDTKLLKSKEKFKSAVNETLNEKRRTRK